MAMLLESPADLIGQIYFKTISGLSKEDALNGKESTITMLEEMQKMLTESIQNSRKAEEISALTTDIFTIADQTNLLAPAAL